MAPTAVANGSHAKESITPTDSTADMGEAWTQKVVDAMGAGTPQRLRDIMTPLIKHVHAFVRESQLTTDEWLKGVEWINWAGQMSNAKRNEGGLLCDVIGLESLVDYITYQKATTNAGSGTVTASAILGPFWRHDAPVRANGSKINVFTPPDGRVAFMHGRVTSAVTGEPLANAMVDIWQASTNGQYEQQDAQQPEHNLRGKFVTDSEGRYSFYCLRPTPYPIPDDGPAGQLLKLMDRHPYRPGHIHLLVIAAGYQTLTTQIYDSESGYLDNDSVFAVKDSLKVVFQKREGDENAEWELKYDIALAPAGPK